MSAPTDKKELTRNERYRIGGTEYRALNLLARLVPLYYLGFLIGFSLCMRIYIACSSYAQEVLNNIDPWFFSIFVSVTAFTNLGLCHLDSSFALFRDSPVPLFLVMTLVLVGNTAYAILLRCIIWICLHLTPEKCVMQREAFRYLLDHPRRCYTTLFPAMQTWWLLIVLVSITLVEWTSFVALNYWLPVLNGIPWASRCIGGLFQAVSTRNAGFSVVSNAELNPGTQLIYIVAMYISVYPVAISMRHSNIYQEKSLGIFQSNEDDYSFTEKELNRRGPDFFVMTQIQRQLTSDICWVITGVFLICILEAKAVMSPSPITMASIIFECVSAFGNVGGSFGYPNTNAAQSAQYRTMSKFVIILLMYRGRHRGLPASIDRSILLPSDTLEQDHKTPSISDFIVNK
ncbi:cation transporter [Backusella circina FSU 941]|nr:cation transporter [Backusella circina FSU 941]